MKKLLLSFALFVCAVWSTAQSYGTFSINGHVAVDLGLPSGTKWATCNVGATKPEDYGSYFAWGETRVKQSYYKRNSQWMGVSYGELQNRGVIDAKGNLAAQYDAATANWGGAWHMPTLAQLEELKAKCDWEKTTHNGIEGYLVTGPSEKSIFLPAAGFCYGTLRYDAGSYGGFWSSTVHNSSNYAYKLVFGSSNYDWSSNQRSYGRSVRPVTK